MSEYKHTVRTVCRFCRRDFESFGLKKVCQDCDNNMEKHFQLIRVYLDEFPEATVADMCSDLDIPVALIKFYLKEERLEVKKNSGNRFLKCENCHKPIIRGRYCFECEIQVTRSDMKSVLVKNSEERQMDKEIAQFHMSKSLRTKNSRK